MEFAAHFKYDRENTLWLSEFMGRALPGTCFPEEVVYDLDPVNSFEGPEGLQLSAALDVDDSQVDISVTMNVLPPSRSRSNRVEFADPGITRDVQDADGSHLRTLVWDDPESRWLELGDPLAGLSVLDSGLV